MQGLQVRRLASQPDKHLEGRCKHYAKWEKYEIENGCTERMLVRARTGEFAQPRRGQLTKALEERIRPSVSSVSPRDRKQRGSSRYESLAVRELGEMGRRPRLAKPAPWYRPAELRKCRLAKAVASAPHGDGHSRFRAWWNSASWRPGRDQLLAGFESSVAERVPAGQGTD